MVLPLPASGEVADELNRHWEGFVPFPFRLREAPLAEMRSLDDLLEWWLSEAVKEEPALVPGDLKAFLDAGQGFILLDGLDEVGTREKRARVMRWLRRHRWVEAEKEGNLVLVTARSSGFEGLEERELPPSRRLYVAPFSHDQIHEYLARWFTLRPLREGQRRDTVEDLVQRLVGSEQSQRLLPLARRPAYLASLAFVHGTRGQLPYTRAALYEQLVDAYVEVLDRQRGILAAREKSGELPVWDRQEKLEVLAAVASQAHFGATAENRKTRPGEAEDRRILWRRQELEEAVAAAIEFGAGRFRSLEPGHARLLTDYFVARTGLLVESREGLFQFGHLSFQEYLTALFLLNQASAAADKAEALENLLFPLLERPGWLEVAVLVLAIDANRTGGQGHPAAATARSHPAVAASAAGNASGRRRGALDRRGTASLAAGVAGLLGRGGWQS